MKRALFTIGLSLIGLLGANAQSVSTWAGSSTATGTPSGSARLSSKISSPWGIAKDSTKGYYWISSDSFGIGSIIMIDPVGNKVYNRVGGGTSPVTGFMDASSTSAEMGQVQGIVVFRDTIYFCDYGNNAIRKVSKFVSVGSAQAVKTIAGGGGNLGSQAGAADTADGQGYGVKGAYFNGPSGMGINPITGDLIVADQFNSCIRGVHIGKNNYGKTFLIAGRKLGSGAIDGAPTTSAKFNSPEGLWVDVNGDIYVVQNGFLKIRKIPFDKATGKYDKSTSTIDLATSMAPGIEQCSMNCLLKAATLSGGSTFYFTNGSSVIANDLSGTGKTTLVAGYPGSTWDMSGDSSGYKDGAGKSALFNRAFSMLDISTSTSKLILVADHDNNRIRQIDLSGKFTAIEDQTPVAKGEGFKVYPNPASDMVTIENFDIPTGTTTNITVYDMTGKVMYGAINDFMGRFHVELNGFPKGGYILKVQNDKVNFTSKIIVNH